MVLSYFKLLRMVEENIYLCSASLNIMNSLVDLTFSCDGTHYIPVSKFLQKTLPSGLVVANYCNPIMK